MSAMSVFDAEWVAEQLELQTPACAVQFTDIVADSRQIQPGSLFVCLQGERVDGHDFVDQAIAAGAKGILCVSGRIAVSVPAAVVLYEVADTLAAYRVLSGKWRQQFSIPVICVAGSVGKTTTKELLAAALAAVAPAQVLKTEGSENGFIGIPKTLLRLRSHHRFAVIEVGIDDVGAMAEHLTIVAPTLSIVTAIGPEHLEKLIDMETVAREELKALEYTLEHGGITVVNFDDPAISSAVPALTKATTKQLWGYSAKLGAPGVVAQIAMMSAPERTVRGYIVTTDDVSSTLELRGGSAPSVHCKLPLPGEHNARNAVGALAICWALLESLSNIDAIAKAARELEQFKAAPGRSEVSTMANGVTVFRDYYNANPSSVRAALAILVQHARGANRSTVGRTFACLGDMLELGPNELEYHRALAPVLVEYGINFVCLYGPRMAALAEKLSMSQLSTAARHFSNREELASFVLDQLKSNDRVLIKGSRGMRMEQVWQQMEPRLSQIH
jgi:UDP-N-acetylmuramoyl-tripeptide--D-alanyl-D-alanine ligase